MGGDCLFFLLLSYSAISYIYCQNVSSLLKTRLRQLLKVYIMCFSCSTLKAHTNLKRI